MDGKVSPQDLRASVPMSKYDYNSSLDFTSPEFVDNICVPAKFMISSSIYPTIKIVGQIVYVPSTSAEALLNEVEDSGYSLDHSTNSQYDLLINFRDQMTLNLEYDGLGIFCLGLAEFLKDEIHPSQREHNIFARIRCIVINEDLILAKGIDAEGNVSMGVAITGSYVRFIPVNIPENTNIAAAGAEILWRLGDRLIGPRRE